MKISKIIDLIEIYVLHLFSLHVSSSFSVYSIHHLNPMKFPQARCVLQRKTIDTLQFNWTQSKSCINSPSIFSTSEPESDDSVSVGHFVALMIDSSLFFDMPNTSSRQISWISSLDLPLKWKTFFFLWLLDIGLEFGLICNFSFILYL